MKRLIRGMIFPGILICLVFALSNTALASEMRVSDQGVNFRTGPSLGASVIDVLDVDVRAEVLEYDPTGWSKVIVGTTTGYIKSDYLTDAARVDIVKYKTTGDVNFRSGPSLNASIYMTLGTGTAVEMLELDPSGWSKVALGGTTGYIKSEFLVISGGGTAIAESTGTSGPLILKTIDGVNFRNGPSTDAGLISTLSANTSVEILERDSNGWAKVKIEESVGYIRADLLSLTGRNVELLNWSDVKKILKTGVPIRVYDVRAGVTYNIKCFSIGDHADVEPITKADTDVILNVRNGVWSWDARPVWVTIGDRLIAASIHGMPHDVSTIPDNGMNGHLCLHFLGSTTTSSSASYKQDLQNAVNEAWNAR